MDHFYKQPKYFSSFSCTGNDCPDNCCYGWEIFWTKNEYEKLRSSKLSDDLKRMIDNSFKFSEEKDTYIINFDENGKCPFLDCSTGLCRIQKEIGANYLSIVCRLYPRRHTESGSFITRWCSTSCYHMVDLLAEDEDAIVLETHIARDYRNLKNTTMIEDSDLALKNAPIKKYRLEMLEFFAELLCDKSRDIDTSIILGAFAAKHISDTVLSGHYERIPQILNDLKPQLNNPNTANSLSEIQPNYQLKFKIVNNMIVKYFGNNSKDIDIHSLHNGNELIVENYLSGIDNLYKSFDNKTYLLKNIIINLFYDLRTPIGFIKRSVFENYSYFVVAAAAIRIIAAAIGFSSNNIPDDFKKGVSKMCRGLLHSEGKAFYTMDEINELGLTTPAHLALIIKG